MTSRIEIINDALASTGNNDCAEFDGSDEWRVGEMAYRRSVGFLLNRHRWGFAKTTWPLNATAATNVSATFQYSYPRPLDCLHIEALLSNSVSTTAYQIIDDKICCNFSSGLVLQGVRIPPMAQWPLHWVELLTMRCEQIVYEALNEDQGASGQKAGAVERYLSEIRTATDQESPRRVMFKSRVANRRRGGGFAG